MEQRILLTLALWGLLWPWTVRQACAQDLEQHLKPADEVTITLRDGSTRRGIVESVSANESPLLKKDFYNSLLAAFTPTEIQDQLRAAGLNLGTEQLGPRHFCVSGRLPATASA